MKTIASLCFLGLFATLPSCVQEAADPAANRDAKTDASKDAKPTSKPSTTSKPSKKADEPGENKGAPVTAPAFVDIKAAGVKALLEKDKDIVVLDIRTPKEYAAGHVEGAKNIDFFAADFAKQIDKLDKSKHYLVHCRSGGRSGKSMPKFKELGFLKITHLADGWNGWTAADLPIKK